MRDLLGEASLNPKRRFRDAAGLYRLGMTDQLKGGFQVWELNVCLFRIWVSPPFISYLGISRGIHIKTVRGCVVWMSPQPLHTPLLQMDNTPRP